jgi:hypothetical protein
MAAMATRRKSKQRNRPTVYSPSREARVKALLDKGLIHSPADIPLDAIPAALDLQLPCNTYCPKIFYRDDPFLCKDCGKPQIWTAMQQRWWYEQCKGNINSMALYCRECRKKRREQKEAHRLATLAGIERKRERAVKKAS